MDKYFDDFRMNMKFYREQAGFSQTYLSILCNCGTGTIGGIESGKAKPSLKKKIKIANALNINPADFFIRNASKNKNELRKSLESEFDSILNKYI